MTKKELIKLLEKFDGDFQVVIVDDDSNVCFGELNKVYLEDNVIQLSN